MMNRKEFMRQLELLLSDISEDERREALDYYESYFDEAGEAEEASVIQKLGSPGKVAAIIKADLRENGGDAQDYREDAYEGQPAGGQEQQYADRREKRLSAKRKERQRKTDVTDHSFDFPFTLFCRSSRGNPGSCGDDYFASLSSCIWNWRRSDQSFDRGNFSCSFRNQALRQLCGRRSSQYRNRIYSYSHRSCGTGVCSLGSGESDSRIFKVVYRLVSQNSPQGEKEW